ncbi:MAG: DUF4255 domain-containing protein [Chloroflexaceae bacterium]|nr:DUF4255 domain-containing protein [Chloroflexaceae bacterium]
MAGYSAVQATSEAIRALLHDRRPREDPTLATMSVRLAQPADFEGGKIKDLNTGIAVVLYRVGPGAARRALPPRLLADGRRLPPPLTLDLHYLLAAFGVTAAQQHLALGWCALTLQMQTIIPPAVLNRYLVEAADPSPPDPLLAEALRFLPDEAVELSPEPLTLQELSQLWDGARPILALGYVARTVRLDPALSREEAPAVRERVFMVGEAQL